MSATRDLIAAALTAADELDELHKEGRNPATFTPSVLREACARAMVQPVSEVPMPEPVGRLYFGVMAERDAAKMVPAEYRGAKVGTEDGGEAYSAGYFDGRAAGYAAGVAAIGWRDVADELPKEAQEVLFVRGGKTLHGAWIGGIFWHSNQKMVAAKWMPLPAPQIDAALRGEVK